MRAFGMIFSVILSALLGMLCQHGLGVTFPGFFWAIGVVGGAIATTFAFYQGPTP